jgi:hypothetical protein
MTIVQQEASSSSSHTTIIIQARVMQSSTASPTFLDSTSLPSATLAPSAAACGDGIPGNGVCSDTGLCCSSTFFCGTGPDFCFASSPSTSAAASSTAEAIVGVVVVLVVLGAVIAVVVRLYGRQRKPHTHNNDDEQLKSQTPAMTLVSAEPSPLPRIPPPAFSPLGDIDVHYSSNDDDVSVMQDTIAYGMYTSGVGGGGTVYDEETVMPDREAMRDVYGVTTTTYAPGSSVVDTMTRVSFATRNTGVSFSVVDEHASNDERLSGSGGIGNETYSRKDVEESDQGYLFDVIAPPGRLGLVITTPNGSSPQIFAIAPDSPLVGQVDVGIKLVAIDGTIVTRMSAMSVTQILSSKSGCSRVLTFASDENTSVS